MAEKDMAQGRHRHNRNPLPCSRWRRIPIGDSLWDDGVSSWRVRGPMWGLRMFWLYHDGLRYTPTGLFRDAMSFRTRRAAKAFADKIRLRG